MGRWPTPGTRARPSRISSRRSTETIFYNASKRATRPLSDAARVEARDYAAALGEWLNPGAEFLFGGAWSIADMEAALMLHRLIANGDAVDERLEAYARKQWERPSAATFVRHARGEYRSYYV